MGRNPDHDRWERFALTMYAVGVLSGIAMTWVSLLVRYFWGKP